MKEGLFGKVLGGPGKFSVRAGYGIAYQSLAGLQLFTTGGGPPFTPTMAAPTRRFSIHPSPIARPASSIPAFSPVRRLQ